ncbi:ABC transporter permease [Spirulina major]|uniref:ABC transporter permease n=1 Tax=Spirulina major TaxID=270636 RepID=UPI0009339066|nr:ABC transporter permease [Spirulina major]
MNRLGSQVINDAVAVAQRILWEMGRRRRSLVFWGVFPLSVLILMGVILADRAELPLSLALELAAPATLAGAALFFSCVGGTVATLVAEREQQTLKRLFLSPLSGEGYFLGICGAQGAIALGQTVLLYGVARGMGARFVGAWWLGVVIVGLSILAYVGVGFLLGTQLARRTEDVNTLIAAFGVPLLILGGAFLPTMIFPASLLTIAQFNPIFHMTEALTGVWADGATVGDIRDHLSILAGFAIAMLILGGLSYQQMLRRERRF